MELVGEVKNYGWGKIGTDSLVANLAKTNIDNFSIDESIPYAELWMGTHPSGQCKVKSSGKKLGSVLGKNLPFLFKVLSLRRACSLQVHPNKLEAARLHREHPEIYKDANHKPELAIALTPFKALVGFRPYEEIYQFLDLLPPLRLLLGGEQNISKIKTGKSECLRNCFNILMTSQQQDVDNCVAEICKKHASVLSHFGLLNSFNTIMQDFPNDVGVLAIFFLNMVRLEPGQAIFLGAKEIHAYLSGDCIECMACSDNNIRGGLTDKFKDVNELVRLLNYEGVPWENKLYHPRRIDKYAMLFAPPVDDFAIIQLHLPACVQGYRLAVKPVVSILLVLQGERMLHIKKHHVYENDNNLPIKGGSIVYIPPEAAPEIHFYTFANKKNTDKFIAYLAMANALKS